MRPRRLEMIVGGGLAAAVACAPVPLGDGERLTVVKAVTTDVILPAFDDASRAAKGLAESVSALTAGAGATPANLEAARASWRQARLAWKGTTPFLFGPGQALGVADAIDWFPVDRKKLEEIVAAADPITPEAVALLGANRRGFHAMEQLLFDGAEPGAGALVLLAGDEPAAARRRALLSALADHVGARVEDLRAAWTPGAGGHSLLFTGPGHPGSPYATVRAALDALVNEAVTVAESATNKLAKPIGLPTGGEPRPELEESGPSDHTLPELAANLRAIRALYLGGGAASGATPPRGIAVLVKMKSAALDGRIRAALETALTRLEAVPRPLRSALLARDPTVLAAYEAVREVKRLAATELVATLGATLKFNDNDGD